MLITTPKTNDRLSSISKVSYRDHISKPIAVCNIS